MAVLCASIMFKRRPEKKTYNHTIVPLSHPRSLISAFSVRCLDSIIPLLAIAEILRL